MTGHRDLVDDEVEPLTEGAERLAAHSAFDADMDMQDMQESLQDSLSVLMGILPLIAGVAEVYTQRKADREPAT